MSPEEYERRIREVEAYYDRRMFAVDYRERLYPPDAAFILSKVSEAIESDVYEMPREQIATGRPWMDALIRTELARWDAQWERDELRRAGHQRDS